MSQMTEPASVTDPWDPHDRGVLAPNAHPDRPVRIVSTSGASIITKRCRRGTEQEAWDAMVDLWASPFGEARRPPGIPRPIGYDADSGVMAMERLVGAPIGRRGHLPRPDHQRAAATLTADLHGSGVSVPRVRNASKLIRSARRRAAKLTEGPLRTWYLAVVDTLEERTPIDPELVLCHGDLSPRNIVGTPTGLRFIDFDRLQMSHPGRDVTYWGAWAWATFLLRDDPPTWSVGDRFIAHYLDDSGRDAAELWRSVPWHRSLGLLRITEWSSMSRRPDLVRRLLGEAERLARAS